MHWIKCLRRISESWKHFWLANYSEKQLVTQPFQFLSLSLFKYETGSVTVAYIKLAHDIIGQAEREREGCDRQRMIWESEMCEAIAETESAQVQRLRWSGCLPGHAHTHSTSAYQASQLRHTWYSCSASIRLWILHCLWALHWLIFKSDSPVGQSR